jgi:hypothetical protein
MDWIKASQALPDCDAEVLVRCRTIVSVAVYHKAEKKFILRNGSYYESAEQALEWLGLISRKKLN